MCATGRCTEGKRFDLENPESVEQFLTAFATHPDIAIRNATKTNSYEAVKRLLREEVPNGQ